MGHAAEAFMGSSGAHLSAIASTYDAERRSWGGGQNCGDLILNGDNAADLFDHLLTERETIDAALGPLT
ncbi:MAG: hypothetical protein F4Z77_08900 [Dehalococcoidia bacterium]|nr:hypothetical protein [Dehalococcoidia bacterium]MYA52059.1 hypothetical protein [Dehalococcoidia bacterium]